MSSGPLIFPRTFVGIGLDPRGTTMEMGDSALRTEGGNGATHSLARNNRPATTTFTCRYVELRAADRQAISDFWDRVRGGSKAFIWIEPFFQRPLKVRFANDALAFTYGGVGQIQLWNTELRFETTSGLEASVYTGAIPPIVQPQVP